MAKMLSVGHLFYHDRYPGQLLKVMGFHEDTVMISIGGGAFETIPITELAELLLDQERPKNAWHPISTAPKDIRILLYYPHDDRLSVGIWSDFNEWFLGDHMLYQSYGTVAKNSPSHWMHLPKRPIMKQEEHPPSLEDIPDE